MVMLGVAAGLWLGRRRWVARGGDPQRLFDVCFWAIPFGLVGARLYHVLTSSDLYFGPGRDALHAFYIWDGGIGIWGAITGGALGAWIGCRRQGVAFATYADAVAPGIALGQAIGRWGNWFNQELFGRPTSVPWGLRIDPGQPGTVLGEVAYHPVFLYESLWCLGVVYVVVWTDRRFHLDRGRAFAVYAAAYTAGRFWTEYLRVDDAHHLLGLRLNDWTSLPVFVAALTYLVIVTRRATDTSQTAPAPA